MAVLLFALPALMYRPILQSLLVDLAPPALSLLPLLPVARLQLTPQQLLQARQ